MPLLFAFWPLDAAARPAPFDPWGDACPLAALDDAEGPFLTVTDEATAAVVFAGDASADLRAYALARTGETPAGCPVEAAQNAARLVAADVAEEWGQDAADEWRCPDPDTYRTGPLPVQVAKTLRTSAGAAGRDAAAADFGAALARALTCRTLAPFDAPLRLAA